MASAIKQCFFCAWQKMGRLRQHFAFKVIVALSFFVVSIGFALFWSMQHFFPDTVSTFLGDTSKPKPLVVLITKTPSIYDEDHLGHSTGFEYDLLTTFARSQNLAIRFVEVDRLSEAYDMLLSGRAHLAAIRLPKPEPWNQWSRFPVSRPYMITDFTVVSRQKEEETPMPDFWLTKQVAIPELSSAAWLVAEHGEHFTAFSEKWAYESSTWGAFDRVARGDSEVTVTDAHTFNVARHVFSYLAADDPLIADAEVGFIFSNQVSKNLIDQLNLFISQSQLNGLTLRLQEKHFGDLYRLSELDIATFLSRIETILPHYKPIFKEAEKQTGLDWRLIAALAYQESHWNPEAVSYTSVKGFMMLTTETAKELGVTDRDNAQQSILAGAQYLLDLKSRLPENIKDPERTWMALAAYNLGYRGFSVGRQLAEQQSANANHWHELKFILPKLPQSKLVEDAGLINARGGEAVILVERVRAFYRILCLVELS